MKERADKLLVEQGLVQNRSKAKALIMAGLVRADGKKVEKPGDFINKKLTLAVEQTLSYVGRGGLKLEKALDEFEVDVRGMTVADLGASVGGFVDCVLQRGAQRVYAVDVDTRQVDWNLRNNPKVILIDKNARYLEQSDFDAEIDLVTMDLSFISILKVLPAVKEFIKKGHIICLVKPQFEAGKKQVGKTGIIKEYHVHEEVLEKIAEGVLGLGIQIQDLTESPIKGQKGNREFFFLCSLYIEGLSTQELTIRIKETVWNENN
ncbi:MAG: TlyA family rRNA (cytidine-2'-O)-methyltransferase [Candidatus Aminicenantes bacterium]|nr:TlyA family rRNA (cytidine-2'-O)-methyltransferase [Candidatus Aminicenantes bacterium]